MAKMSIATSNTVCLRSRILNKITVTLSGNGNGVYNQQENTGFINIIQIKATN